jgi:2-keto-3-deoxy-L-rhamnonate aldolase RhmA
MAVQISCLKKKAQEQDFLLGAFVFSTDPALPEIYSAAGFDFVVIDMEHGFNDFGNALAHLRSARGAGINALVRVGQANLGNVTRLLDAGCEGIIVPHYGVKGSGATEAFQSMRYCPEGNRPTCTGVRAVDYGLSDFAAYVERSNREVLRIGLVEDRECIDSIDEILNKGEVDWLTPGPADLATSMGLPGQLRHPQVVDGIEKMMAAARRRNIPFGMYINDPNDVPTWLEKGSKFFILRIDLLWLARSLKVAADACRELGRAKL